MKNIVFIVLVSLFSVIGLTTHAEKLSISIGSNTTIPLQSKAYLRATPQMYLFDKEKKIIAKPFSVNELKALVL